MSSCQFRSPPASALPCNFRGASDVLTTCLGSQDRLFTRMDTPASMLEKRVCSYLPSPFEVPPMLSDAGLVCQSVPGATEKKSRASKTDDVRINFCARVSQSMRSARAQHIVENNSRAHAVKKKIWKRWTDVYRISRQERPSAGRTTEPSKRGMHDYT